MMGIVAFSSSGNDSCPLYTSESTITFPPSCKKVISWISCSSQTWSSGWEFWSTESVVCGFAIGDLGQTSCPSPRVLPFFGPVCFNGSVSWLQERLPTSWVSSSALASPVSLSESLSAPSSWEMDPELGRTERPVCADSLAGSRTTTVREKFR